MSRIVFMLEEPSMKVFLEGLLPRLYPGLRFLCVAHNGKQELERSIPRKLKAWQVPGDRFCVIRDNDGGDCVAVKGRLQGLCRDAGRPDAVVRIACQELEAWYFGDLAAVADEYEDESVARMGDRKGYRDPDAIAQPSRRLAELVPGFQKVSGARRLGVRLVRENRSRSYMVFLEAMDRLVGEVAG